MLLANPEGCDVTERGIEGSIRIRGERGANGEKRNGVA